MTATKKDIEHWLAIAKKNNSAFLIVGLDPLDHDNFPVYCASGLECHEALNRLRNGGNSYDEVYNMAMDIPSQVSEHRAMNLPKL